MKYYIVGAGCGDPGLITVKGMELLQKADVLIYAGSLVNPELVAKSPATLKLDSWGMKLEEITSVIAESVRAGKVVVRLHSGDPAIYGSIVEQIAPLEEDGIHAEIVPGVSSMFGAAAALQTEYTLRGVSESVIVTRSAGETLDSDQLAELSEHGTTMVIFLSTGHIDAVMKKLRRCPETPVAVVYHASWPDQQIIRGTIADIAGKVHAAGIERSALIIVGDVVAGIKAAYTNSHLYG
ncbi:precorrin-4 C(11)-methyltransferase [Methanocorpusculum sp. MG]|uniref:Precorrin-4 C(11)-methyltransferase n=1 Tax=Methanocorpusculum petauri TaxID=3002863 RepID=A0ABT4IE87_9EURY|nr:precorrin-4 C(11)-methyltransferase [Methanocorpusculum petauri]MCZ0860048.1 precorrin-4 C(11)-methyltransferase [Methanocorpusculum petauri]MDE2443044.1 precorrin-4 C(11)-methyltransferase [Methanocorpusculum sp.]